MIALLFAGCKKEEQVITQKETVEQVIEQAQTMSLSELYRRAATESDGKVFYGIGNSSRGSAAGETFVKELQKINPSYSGKIEWFVPKNNSIFTLLTADAYKITPVYSMTLIQDGNLIQRKMLNTGYLLNYIPKEWKDAPGTNEQENGHPFALQTLNKVFEFNNTNNSETFRNCWDFVYKDVHPLFMGVDGEPVGKNFLYMLTNDTYASYLKDAYNALPQEKKDYFDSVINGVSSDVARLGLTSQNAKYALAYIKLWCAQYRAMVDDGPICTELTDIAGSGKCGLLVYSKFRSIKETQTSSVNNATVAAYQDGYKGIGGYAYKHYLQIPRTSPLPWTACAFIAYMTTSKEGFYPWGRDMGGYCSNPACNQEHSKDGYADGAELYPAKNDRGYDWWISPSGGRLVVENPEYCAKVSAKLADWIDEQAGLHL